MERTQAYGGARSKVSAGAMLVAIGLLHQLVGVLFGLGVLSPFEGAPFAAPLLDILRDGVVGAVEPHAPRMILFWFLMTGFCMILAGWLAHVLERARALPGSFAVALGAFSLTGAVLIPVSGFWLGLIPAVVAWRRARVAVSGQRVGARNASP